MENQNQLKRISNLSYSNFQPIWQFVLFSIISFGLYDFFWFYKNWKLLKEKLNLKIWPLPRAIFILFFGVEFCERILCLAKEKGYNREYSPGLIIVGCIYIISLQQLRSPYWLISSFAFLPLILVVNALNYYWKQEQPDHIIKTRLSKREIAFTVIFSIFYVLVVTVVL